MRIKILIFGLVLLGNNLSAQKKFSFLDCVSISISGGYNFQHMMGPSSSEKVLVNNIYQGNKEESSLRLKNYLSYSIESTYYLKAYRNLRLGVGAEYTIRKNFFEYVSTPISIGKPTVIVKYDKKYNVFGPFISIAYAIPKWKLRLIHHSGYLFVRNRRVFDQDVNHNEYYFYNYVSGNQIIVDGYKVGGHELDEITYSDYHVVIPASAWVQGLEVRYRISPRLYMLVRFRRTLSLYVMGIQHVRYEEIDGVSKQYKIGSASVGGTRYQVGIGVAYHFFEKE